MPPDFRGLALWNENAKPVDRTAALTRGVLPPTAVRIQRLLHGQAPAINGSLTRVIWVSGTR